MPEVIGRPAVEERVAPTAVPPGAKAAVPVEAPFEVIEIQVAPVAGAASAVPVIPTTAGHAAEEPARLIAAAVDVAEVVGVAVVGPSSDPATSSARRAFGPIACYSCGEDFERVRRTPIPWWW